MKRWKGKKRKVVISRILPRQRPSLLVGDSAFVVGRNTGHRDERERKR